MVKFSDIVYYNFLKKGAIIIVILGILIGIISITYAINWIKGVGEISETSTRACSENVDCFEWCGECASVRDARTCGPEGIRCICINKTCQQT